MSGCLDRFVFISETGRVDAPVFAVIFSLSDDAVLRYVPLFLRNLAKIRSLSGLAIFVCCLCAIILVMIGKDSTYRVYSEYFSN